MIRVTRWALLLVLLLPAPAPAQGHFSALLADKAEAAHQKQLMVFGRFVGTWSFTGVEYHEDGTTATDNGEIQFHWVLRGKAIQDVWLETARSDHGPKIYGTTLRFYDPAIHAWKAVWIDPVFGTVQTLTGGKVGDRIVLQGRQRGVPIRWIFSQIEPNSFYWYGEKKSGKKWRKYEEVRAHRRQ